MTQRSKALGMVALVAAAGLTLTGCGKSNTGTPATTEQTTTTASSSAAAANTTTDSTSAQWDPCTIPDSTISSLGLNTVTKSNQVAGTTFDGWHVCSWNNGADNYAFTIFSSGHTLDELKQRTDREEFTPTTVGSHTAVQYRPVGASHDQVCYISAEIPNGLVDFSVQERYGVAPAGADPCAEVRRLVDALGQYLPGS